MALDPDRSLDRGYLHWPEGGAVDNAYAGCVLYNTTRSVTRISAILLRGVHYDGQSRCFLNVPSVVVRTEGWRADDVYSVRRDLILA